MTSQNVQDAIKSEYSHDNTWVLARERLALLEARADPGTIRHLEALGVGDGWRCLEIGGGGGSITAWLCRRVGPAGRVVATDINTRFLEALDFRNLEVRVHNIVADDLEQGAFDLVHARTVLMHLRQRPTALERMVSALKPGPGRGDGLQLLRCRPKGWGGRLQSLPQSLRGSSSGCWK